MNFYMSAKVWDKHANAAPHSSKRAMPIASQSVRNATVIVVKEAKYRGATFSGPFLLGDNNELPLPRSGSHSVEVYCCWFGFRLKTCGPSIKVDMSTAKVIKNYSGDVISNLGHLESDFIPQKFISNFDTHENFIPTKKFKIRNDKSGVGEILVASFAIILVAEILNGFVPHDEYQWARLLGSAVGVALVGLIVNEFFRFYGVLFVFTLYSISLLYGK
jgi:hypothetical protein